MGTGSWTMALAGTWQGGKALTSDAEVDQTSLRMTIDILQREKASTNLKLEAIHSVLEKERVALREILAAARKAVEDLKGEKNELEQNIYSKDLEIARLREAMAKRHLAEEEHLTAEAMEMESSRLRLDLRE